MSRKKAATNNNKMLIFASLGLVVLVFIAYMLFFRADNPSPASFAAVRDINIYDTMMQNNAHWKRSELRESRENDSQTLRKITWLTNIKDIVGLIPWESTYLATIQKKEVENNTAFATLRVDLISRFQFIRDKFDAAIGDPTDDKIADAIGTMRSNKQLVRDAIREVRSKSGAIGQQNSELLAKLLNGLLTMMDSNDYD